MTFFPFDDPDFDRALSAAMESAPAVEPLVDQALASDHLYAAIATITDQYKPLALALEDRDQALTVVTLLAFMQGYRTGRIQP